jgi:hypothetical protein
MTSLRPPCPRCSMPLPFEWAVCIHCNAERTGFVTVQARKPLELVWLIGLGATVGVAIWAYLIA